MVALSEYKASKFTKIMYIGDSSTGKTGSLVSLVAAGYKLRILDLDNGLDVLDEFIRKDCPDKLDTVDAETRYDEYKSTPGGPVVRGLPTAFVECTKLLTTWSDGTDPAEWGEDHVLVIDSLDGLGKWAFEWARGLNSTAKDPRQWYFAGQQAIDNILAMLMSGGFKTNVIVISHVKYDELDDGTIRGVPTCLGSAMGPVIPKYFNTLVLADSRGSGKNVTRVIQTVPTTRVNLKTPAPFKIDAELPLPTGLATLFEQLKS